MFPTVGPQRIILEDSVTLAGVLQACSQKLEISAQYLPS